MTEQATTFDKQPELKSVSRMDSEKQQAAVNLAHDNVDAALEFLNAESTSVTEVNEKDLVRKIDWRIVPLMCK